MKIATDIVLALVCALLFPRLIGDGNISVENALLPAILFGGLIGLFRFSHWKKTGWRRMLFSHLAGTAFSVMTAFGFWLEKQGAVDYGSWTLWLSVGVYAHVYAQLLSLLWGLLEKWEPSLGTAPRSAVGRAVDWFLGKPWLVLPVILLLWLPCWLATYPGNFVYDATKEFSQLEKGWMGDFPMLHSVLIVKLLAWSFDATGGYNTGIAAFTFGQMVLLAAMFTHMLCKFRALGGNRWALLAMTVYCAAFPAVHVLVTSTVRDVLFAGLLTYSVFLLWSMCRDGALRSWWKPVFPAAVLVLTVFSRNNNTGLVMPLALVAVAGVLFWLGGKQGWKGALVFSASSVLIYLCLGAVLSGFCGPVSPPSVNASMTLYSQTLFRAYTLEEENLSAEDKLAMLEFCNMKNVQYVPENGDSTKGRLLLTEENKPAFMTFWRSMGSRYPHHYCDAILLNTRQAWFPGAVMDGYQRRDIAMYRDYEKCWFFYADVIEEPGVLESKWPALHDWYRDLSLNLSFEKVPVLGLLFSVGFHFWFLLGCLFYAFCRKNRHGYLPLGILLVYTIASMCVPLMILRYFAALIFAFSLVVMITLQPGMGCEENGIGEKK